MELKKFAGLLLLTIILSSSLTYVLYKGFYKELEISEIGMDLMVTANKKSYGINIDTDAIHFGMLPVGGGAVRHLNITNTYDYDVFVYITKDNSTLSGIVSIVPNSFVLKPDENKKINAAISVPEWFKAGNYNGSVTVIVRAPFFRISEIARDKNKTFI